MNSIIYRLLGAVIGLLVGCLVLALLYVILQMTMELLDVSRTRFRAPVALFILPLITAFAGFKAGPDLVFFVKEFLGNGGILVRFTVIFPIFWAVVVVAYVIVFEPFGYNMSEYELLFVSKVVLFPIAIFFCGVWVVTKFILRK